MPADLHDAGASAILDDIDARPGSVTSLARTILGAYVRELGGWIAIADFSTLLASLDVPEQSARTTVARLKSKGVLDPETRNGRSGYRLTPAAEAMYTRGDPRIFGFRQMTESDPWHLISFTIPESARAARHQLRRRLTSIGCGTVSPGLWICPHYLAAEATAIITALGLADYVTSFRATDFAVPDNPRAAAARWWNLPSLAALHQAFLDNHSATTELGTLTDEQAFRLFIPLLDEWRTIPYLDPGLPDSMLPTDWPGPASVRLFADARKRCLEPSRRWVHAHTRT
ncbi:PaaX family transcriptional regulator [Nocardia crassostreae]|uniref:PaaX family transcriptional regulator n=1 Tax=Nocardia crassostreae TaxID=53428 RepID=UPI00083518EE|nr:PaaX family transcriptional regulator C-terminal domain-containing protein [Nocardia crassostreae]